MSNVLYNAKLMEERIQKDIVRLNTMLKEDGHKIEYTLAKRELDK